MGKVAQGIGSVVLVLMLCSAIANRAIDVGWFAGFFLGGAKMLINYAPNPTNYNDPGPNPQREINILPAKRDGQ